MWLEYAFAGNTTLMTITLKGEIVVIFKHPGTVQLVNRKAIAAVIQLEEERYLMIQESFCRLLKVVVSKEKSFVAFTQCTIAIIIHS